MQKKNGIRKIVIYFLLAVLIAIGCRRGLDCVEQVSFSCRQIWTETLDTVPIIPNDDCWLEEIDEKRLWVFNVEKRSYGGINEISRRVLDYFFAAMLLLFSLSNMWKSILLYQNTCNPEMRKYHILYMQNQDGCK